MTKAKMLVTGGSGFLGQWVVRIASAEWTVSATYFRSPVSGSDASGRQLDIHDRSAVLSLVEAVCPEVIVHTAALNPGQGSDFKGVNVRGTQNVAEAAKMAGVRLIHLSTDVVFDGKQGRYLEHDAPSPITPYGRSKAAAENLVRESGVSAVIVRTSLIYGPAAQAVALLPQRTPWRQWDRQTRWVLGDLQAGREVGLFTDEIRCPIWVESLASALVEVARLGLPQGEGSEVLHIAGAEAVSRYQFGLALARFHKMDPSGISPTLINAGGLVRPRDCSLDCSRAQVILRAPLPGVGDVLQPAERSSPPGG